LFYNDSVGPVALQIGGATVALLAAGASFATPYCGPATATSAAGANLNVATLQS
jgi:hypothetical protein